MVVLRSLRHRVGIGPTPVTARPHRCCLSSVAFPGLQRPDSPLPTQQSIFANTNLNLEYIKAYGFDYDYTLSNYTPALQTLIYELASLHLVGQMQYPSEVAARQYDPGFAIRGLHYDKKRGLLLKLDAFRNIQTPSRDEEFHKAWARPSTQGTVYRGRQPLTTSEVLAEYNTLRLSERYVHANLHHLHDIFSQPEACLVADTIQHLTDTRSDFDPALVVSDVSKAIGAIHISGLLHRRVAQDIGAYLRPNPAIAQLMTRLRANGERVGLVCLVRATICR